MKLLRKAGTVKVVTPENVELLIKELLQPEALGKTMFVTKLVFSASGVDGKKLRDKIHNWLGKVDIEDSSKSIDSLLDSMKKKGSDGKTAK